MKRLIYKRRDWPGIDDDNQFRIDLAEELVADPPDFYANPKDNRLEVTCSIFSLGMDTLFAQTSFEDIVQRMFDNYMGDDIKADAERVIRTARRLERIANRAADRESAP
jgi:hypothetical protein